MVIEKEKWHSCKICNKNIKDLAIEHGGNRIYYTTVFKKHLEKDHKINLEIYFDISKKQCQCINKCKKRQKITFHNKSDFKIYKIT